jgi:hypothetical protein
MLARAGIKYQEQDYYRVTRGPYTAVRTIDKPYTLTGRYINLLDPTLPLLESPVLPAHSQGFYQDAGPEKGNPRLLALSGRLRARAESATESSWLTGAPTGTGGVARLWSGDRKIIAIRGHNVFGTAVPVTTSDSGDTVLLKYPNDADGVVIRVVWQ